MRRQISPKEFLQRIPNIVTGVQDLYPPNTSNPHQNLSIEQQAEQVRNAAIRYQVEKGTGSLPTVPVTVIDLSEATKQTTYTFNSKHKE